MFQSMKKSLLAQVIVAIIFCSIFVTSMISFILFNFSTTYVENFYENTTSSDRLNSTVDLMSYEEFRALFFSRMIMLLLIGTVVSIYISFNLAELITGPIIKFSEHVSGSADDILHTPLSDDLLNNPNEIGNLARSFDSMRIRIVSSFDQKQEAVNTLVRGVSHSLNTPIGNALSSSSYMEFIVSKDEELSDETKERLYEAISLTTSSLKKSRNILNTFREISVHETERNDVVFDLGEYVKQYIEIISSDGKNSHLRFSIHIEPNMFIKCYPTTIMQILTSLVANTRDHGYANDTGDHPVHIDAFKNKNFINIVFKDFGSGISKEDKLHIFEPFFTTKPLGQKTGLGLSIVYTQVHKIGGQIECLPDHDGAAFIIKLPEYGGLDE